MSNSSFPHMSSDAFAHLQSSSTATTAATHSATTTFSWGQPPALQATSSSSAGGSTCVGNNGVMNGKVHGLGGGTNSHFPSATANVGSGSGGVTTTVKSSALDALLGGGAKRRAEQSKQNRARNRDYYISAKRDRGFGGGRGEALGNVHVGIANGEGVGELQLSDFAAPNGVVNGGMATNGGLLGHAVGSSSSGGIRLDATKDGHGIGKSLAGDDENGGFSHFWDAMPGDDNVSGGGGGGGGGGGMIDGAIRLSSCIIEGEGATTAVAGGGGADGGVADHNTNNTTSSPLALSVRFLSRFRLSGGDSSSMRGSTAIGNSSPPLLGATFVGDCDALLPRLHSQATLGAMRRAAAGMMGSQSDGFPNGMLSGGNEGFGLSSDAGAPAATGSHGTTAQFSRAVALNVQALTLCLESIAETVTEAHRTAGGGVSWIGGRNATTTATSSDDLSFLIEDLNTTLESLLEAGRRSSKLYQLRCNGGRDSRRGAGLGAALPLPSAVLDATIASLFATFVTSIDVYEALYWQVTASAARLLLSDFPETLSVCSSRGGVNNTTSGGHHHHAKRSSRAETTEEHLLVVFGQWLGLATVTCLHALDPNTINSSNSNGGITDSSSTAQQRAKYSSSQLSGSLCGLFTLLLKLAVGDFTVLSEWARVYMRVGGHAAGGVGGHTTIHGEGILTFIMSSYCRQLQEMCTEACAMLLSSPTFALYVGLMETVDVATTPTAGDNTAAHDGTTTGTANSFSNGSNSNSQQQQQYSRQDTEYLSNTVLIEGLLSRSFTELPQMLKAMLASSNDVRGFPSSSTAAGVMGFQQQTAGGGLLSSPLSTSSVHSLLPATSLQHVRSTMHIRDSQENAALLLCVVCAAANTFNAELVERLESALLFKDSFHQQALLQSQRYTTVSSITTPSAPATTSGSIPYVRLAVVTPRITTLAFGVFNEFLTQALADVSRATVVGEPATAGEYHQLNNGCGSIATNDNNAGASSGGVVGGATTSTASGSSSYYDEYTGAMYYSVAAEHGGGGGATTSGNSGPTSNGMGSFQVDPNVSLDGVINALKGLGDLVGISAAIEALRGHGLMMQQQHQQGGDTEAGAGSYPYFSSGVLGPNIQHQQQSATTTDVFAAAADRLDAIHQRRDELARHHHYHHGNGGAGSCSFFRAGSGGSLVSVIISCYAQLRVEVGGRLKAPIVCSSGNNTSGTGGGSNGGSGYDHFRPLLQRVPTSRAVHTSALLASTTTHPSSSLPTMGTAISSTSVCGDGFGGGSGTGGGAAVAGAGGGSFRSASPPPALPLLGADDPLATAFMLAEGVISFYSSDPQLACSVPATVMQYFYSHHSTLFKVATTFSPTSPCGPGGFPMMPANGMGGGGGGGGAAATTAGLPHALAPFMLHASLQSPASPLSNHHITPLMLRCRDALSALYCRAPKLVFDHWGLFSSSILPFLSNQLDSFARRHVLYILAALVKDPTCSEQVIALMDIPEFQEAMSAVMMGGVGGGGGGSVEEDNDEARATTSGGYNHHHHDPCGMLGGGGEHEEDDEAVGANSKAATNNNNSNGNSVSQPFAPFTKEEHALLDIIISGIMGDEGDMMGGMLSGSSPADGGGGDCFFGDQLY